MSLTKCAYGWTVSGRKKHTVKARPGKPSDDQKQNICTKKKYSSKHTFFIKTFLSCCLLAKEALRIQFLVKLETILSLIFNTISSTYHVAGTVTYTEFLKEKELQPCLPGALWMERKKSQTQTNTIVIRLFKYCVLSAYPEPGIALNSRSISSAPRKYSLWRSQKLSTQTLVELPRISHLSWVPSDEWVTWWNWVGLMGMLWKIYTVSSSPPNTHTLLLPSHEVDSLLFHTRDHDILSHNVPRNTKPPKTME